MVGPLNRGAVDPLLRLDPTAQRHRAPGWKAIPPDQDDLRALIDIRQILGEYVIGVLPAEVHREIREKRPVHGIVELGQRLRDIVAGDVERQPTVLLTEPVEQDRVHVRAHPEHEEAGVHGVRRSHGVDDALVVRDAGCGLPIREKDHYVGPVDAVQRETRERCQQSIVYVCPPASGNPVYVDQCVIHVLLVGKYNLVEEGLARVVEHHDIEQIRAVEVFDDTRQGVGGLDDLVALHAARLVDDKLNVLWNDLTAVDLHPGRDEKHEKAVVR